MRKLELEGQRFCKLTVLHRARFPGGRPAWKCRCDCGKETVVNASDLRKGYTKSCGCSKSPIATYVVVCECGQPKHYKATQCNRCQKLDGLGQVQRWIIDYLLDTYEPVPTAEIQWWAGREIEAPPRSVHRSLQSLIAVGRLEKMTMDHNGHAVTGYRLAGVF